jgi:hypothetical protein
VAIEVADGRPQAGAAGNVFKALILTMSSSSIATRLE